MLLLALAFTETELFSIRSIAVVTEVELLVLSILVMTAINELFSRDGNTKEDTPTSYALVGKHPSLASFSSITKYLASQTGNLEIIRFLKGT